MLMQTTCGGPARAGTRLTRETPLTHTTRTRLPPCVRPAIMPETQVACPTRSLTAAPARQRCSAKPTRKVWPSLGQDADWFHINPASLQSLQTCCATLMRIDSRSLAVWIDAGLHNNMHSRICGLVAGIHIHNHSYVTITICMASSCLSLHQYCDAALSCSQEYCSKELGADVACPECPRIPSPCMEEQVLS